MKETEAQGRPSLGFFVDGQRCTGSGIRDMTPPAADRPAPSTTLPVIPFDVHQGRSCEGCGHCCEGIGSPVVLYATRPGWEDRHPYRPPHLPQQLIDEIDFHFSGLTRGQEPQDHCLWHDPVTRTCRHYELRPQVCRDYELASRACLAIRKAHGLPTR